ncbi:endo-1,3(4)-beta-glucanase [Cordyceps javanica]|uniref:Endo-1,3(4)-beta-glucanase n=1 Tax=Cordyceps javanica TaxID=43265 RepID=A0A545WB85_9HYPO|nr:endo-1,3(4)-beta-glucanase [Cordyceps javanica]TQW11244.1 endo-1,3(4)-beta-glucanase [Cordyceps javanica]
MGPFIVWFYLVGIGCARAFNHYILEESYDHTNFFDKFRFFESDYSTGNYNDVDPTSGYINYRNQEDAAALGLIATQGTEMFLGVNHRDVLDPKGKGRDSVRIESKKLYNHGLFIAEFTHLPQVGCGVWPAFWTFGDPWPVKGEMDIYENWNLAKYNMVTLHTGNATEVGSCTISQENMLNPIITSNCDATFQDENQSANQACATEESRGQWGSRSGGVYAMEWTAEHIKLWSWSRDQTPADIKRRQPIPRRWGTPHFFAGGSSCDIDSHFRDQKLVLNIDFCGVAAGNPDLWKQQCLQTTGYENCADYVAKNPDDFANAFWKVKGIHVYRSALNATQDSTTQVFDQAES